MEHSDSALSSEKDSKTTAETEKAKIEAGKRSCFKKWASISLNVFAILLLLYFFVCSVDLMSSGLELVMGSTASGIFKSDIMRNPVAGLMVGVMGTVILQSSSTTTAIIVTLVASNSLPVKQAIPMVMGANIGTSVTNTFVAMGQINVKEEFRRAFAGATVHDMFNWLTVITLLPVEVCTGYLLWLSGLMVSGIGEDDKSTESVDVPGLKLLTTPLTNRIVMIDSDVIENLDAGNVSSDDARILKQNCGDEYDYQKCEALFNVIGWSDEVTGALVLSLSLFSLCLCLVLLVKVLRKVFSHYITDIIKNTVNAKLPPPFACLTGYVAALIGAILTVIIQSSSIFTSTLTPLVGIGVLELETIFPLTLGSNLGTTGTGILTAFANENFKVALQIALCHLLFNLSGFLIWYPIPFLRRIPLGLAELMGRTTADYRWFAVVYLVFMFLIAPLFVFLLSWAGTVVLYSVGGFTVVFLAVVIVINKLQDSEKLREHLPKKLQSWDFLPRFLRSLDPYDELIQSATMKIKKICKKPDSREKRQDSTESYIGTISQAEIAVGDL